MLAAFFKVAEDKEGTTMMTTTTMMRFFFAALSCCFLTATNVVVVTAVPLPTYRATFQNIPGQPAGLPLRSGVVVVFATDDDAVAYSGFASDLDPFLSPSNCTVINGEYMKNWVIE